MKQGEAIIVEARGERHVCRNPEQLCESLVDLATSLDVDGFIDVTIRRVELPEVVEVWNSADGWFHGSCAPENVNVVDYFASGIRELTIRAVEPGGEAT